METSPARRTLTRPHQGRIFAGVCVGIARRFGVSPWLVRVIFLASCFLPGPQFVVYIALWVLVPEDER